MKQLIKWLPVFLLASCSTQHQIYKTGARQLLQDSTLQHAHVGISVYDPESGKFLFQHNDAKYFVPASNTKIFSCYTGMKYLGKDLPGIRYAQTDKGLLLLPTGDPTFLHPDYTNQPVISFLQKQQQPLFISSAQWNTTALGNGWSWNDYNDDYMPERSPLPAYGNVLRWKQDRDLKDSLAAASIYSIPEINWKVNFNANTAKRFEVLRDKDQNRYLITEGKEEHRTLEVPFVTNGISSAVELLKDTVANAITNWEGALPTNTQVVYSQPTDSMLSPMMHRSDNFFAEQTLQMVSQQLLGKFDEGALIEKLLKTDFSDLPQRPTWVDGSGLSRYNLFSPQDFVHVLNRMKNEFGMERIGVVFPTGGDGTLGSLYKDEKGKIFAKTGTLGGVVAFSGFLLTEKNKWLVFSVMVNNHRGSAAAVRKSIEKFVKSVRARY